MHPIAAYIPLESAYIPSFTPSPSIVSPLLETPTPPIREPLYTSNPLIHMSIPFNYKKILNIKLAAKNQSHPIIVFRTIIQDCIEKFKQELRLKG